MKIYSTNEVAEMFGTSRQRISKLHAAGVLKGVRLGKRFSFTEEEIENFMKDHAGMTFTEIMNEAKGNRR